MTTAIQLYGKGYSKANKRFKFVLSNGGIDLTLHYSPKGWNESELTFIRDKFYKGVLESYSTNELTFVKEGRDFIQSAYETSGIDHEVTINIYILNTQLFTYQLYFSGKLDLSTYKIDSIGVTCEIIPTGFQNVVLNRDDIEVDMMSTKYIGGIPDSMEYLSGVWEMVTIPAYQATQNLDWIVKSESVEDINAANNHYPPVNVSFNEWDRSEAENQIFAPVISGAQFIFNSNGSYTVDIVGKIRTDIFWISGEQGSEIEIKIKQNAAVIQSFTDSTTDQDISYEMDVNIAGLVLIATDKISIEATITPKHDGLGNYGTIEFIYTDGNISMFRNVGTALATIDPPMFYIYEAFARTIQLISGVSQPFYSELLGRVDSVPESYLSDGKAALMAITSGKWIRQFDPRTTQLNFSLKGLFKTINAIWNIGLSFEGGRVRVEEEKYFFDVTVNPDFGTDGKYWQVNQILDLSAWLNNEIISKEVLPDWYANEVEGGYGNFEYENVQGLKEFNTKVSWATPIKSVKSKLDLVSEYRADTQGVNKLREKPVSSDQSEDVSGDNDIFVFDVKREGIAPIIYTVKTNEDFVNVGGGIDPQSSYNLNFTPRRNIERHGNRLDSMRLKSTDEIQWLKSDKNNSLVTEKTGEAAKAENEDILVSTLTPGYWVPEAYNFEAPVNLATITALQTNPRGVIKIGVDKYGWILDVQTNNETKKGQFKLLRVDINNVKVTLSGYIYDDYSLQFDLQKNSLYIPLTF